MFRRNKNDNKAKLEYKLYLARENPEPIFDLAECELRTVPNGIYSLCKVFLKELLRLEKNKLTSLSGGGNLSDLRLLQVLNISHNEFNSLPEDICYLTNLQELLVSNNLLKRLPESIGALNKLRTLDVSNNKLKSLPESIGNLSNLKTLNLTGNNNLNRLPKTICNAQRLRILLLDSANFHYPPDTIASEGTESIMKYISEDCGIPYIHPESLTDEHVCDVTDELDSPSDNIQQQKLQEFLELERQNELLQRQEIELAQAHKVNRQKLLADIAMQQSKFDSDLTKIQQERELDRFRLVEQLLEMENTADTAINKLLESNKEPLAQLLEMEREEENRLLAAASKYNETLRKDDILAAIEVMLHNETEQFNIFHQARIETSKSILEQEMDSDSRLVEILQGRDYHRADLLATLEDDDYLQKAAVATLLERSDARSWGLLQQVRLVESQLAALTLIEMDRKKLELDQHLNNLAEKRINLSILLIELLDQQRERRSQLLSTLQIMEESNETVDHFWLKQYQNLLDKLPPGLSDAQKNMDPKLVQALLFNEVIHCLPFLAKFTQYQNDLKNVTDDDLLEAGITSRIDRAHILDAFQIHMKEEDIYNTPKPTAPLVEVEEASAPLPDLIRTSNMNECVICLDKECDIIFVPCGHLCCCSICSTQITECPLCRSDVERKIKIVDL